MVEKCHHGGRHVNFFRRTERLCKRSLLADLFIGFSLVMSSMTQHGIGVIGGLNTQVLDKRSSGTLNTFFSEFEMHSTIEKSN